MNSDHIKLAFVCMFLAVNVLCFLWTWLLVSDVKSKLDDVLKWVTPAEEKAKYEAWCKDMEETFGD